MQDNKQPAAPIDTDDAPPSQDQTNQPGMTNGVPEGATDAEPKGSPSNDRHETQTGPARKADIGSDT